MIAKRIQVIDASADKIAEALDRDGEVLVRFDGSDEALAAIAEAYVRESRESGSMSRVLKKYRIPWRDEPEPSFLDGFARAFDFLGVLSPRSKLPAPNKSREPDRSWLRELFGVKRKGDK